MEKHSSIVTNKSYSSSNPIVTICFKIFKISKIGNNVFKISEQCDQIATHGSIQRERGKQKLGYDQIVTMWFKNSRAGLGFSIEKKTISNYLIWAQKS